MKLKEFIIRFVILLPFYTVFFLIPYIVLFFASRLFELLSFTLEACAYWLQFNVWLFRDWILVVTGIEEKESADDR